MAFERVARVEDVPDGGAIAVTAGGERIALCRANGMVYAIADACTHDGGGLSGGDTFGYVIECPRHGSQFDMRTGQVLRPPADEPVRVFRARVVDGAIEVDAAS